MKIVQFCRKWHMASELSPFLQRVNYFPLLVRGLAVQLVTTLLAPRNWGISAKLPTLTTFQCDCTKVNVLQIILCKTTATDLAKTAQFILATAVLFPFQKMEFNPLPLYNLQQQSKVHNTILLPGACTSSCSFK